MTSANEQDNSKTSYAVDFQERLRLMRDGLINNSSLLISAPIGIVLVPIMLRGLGNEDYGLWVAAVALGSLISIDFGILASTTRVVAGVRVTESPEEMSRFVGAAWIAYLTLGFLGAALIGGFGLALTRGLHLSAQSARVAPFVFCLAGLYYWGSRLVSFTTAVLEGLRRFDWTNLIGIGSTLISAAGTIFLLFTGSKLVAVAAWLVVVKWASLIVAAFVVRRLEPSLDFGFGRFKWIWIRPHVSFGLWSQMSDFAQGILMRVGPLLVGTVLDSSAITPFAVGQKFPIAISSISLGATDVIFPAASQAGASKQSHAARQIVELSTRWLFLLMLPLYLGLAIVAPRLLSVWIGEASPDVAAILRLTSGALAVAALSGGSEQVLWGLGKARAVFGINAAGMIVNLILTFYFLRLFGVEGAALGFLAGMILRSILFLRLSGRVVGTGMFRLLHGSLQGIFLPAAACGVVTWGVLHIAPGGWLGMIAASLAGGMAYGSGLYFGGARPEERLLAREVFFSPITLVRIARRGLLGK